MLRYSTVVFDLDGTLLNTLDDLVCATNHALARHGMPARTTDEVRAFVGNGIANLIRLAVPAGTSAEVVQQVHATFDAYYAAHSKDRTAPYPGVPALVEKLVERGVHCCVVSNKGDYAVRPLVRHFFADLFEVAVGERESEGIRRKPWPDTVLACMRVTGSESDKCVYVGDSEVDVRTAQNAGIDCISVSWGFRSVACLLEAGATTIVDTPAQLLEALE